MALSMPYANPGGTPLSPWPGGTFPQGQIDFALNRTYTRLVADLGDIELLTKTLIFPTIQSQYQYQIQNLATKTAIGDYAQGTVVFTGTVAAGQTPTVTIGSTVFSYTTLGADTIAGVIQQFINQINKSAIVVPTGTTVSPSTPVLNTLSTLGVFAGLPGTAGNATALSATSSGTLTLTASAGTLLGGTNQNQPIRMVRRVWYQPLGQLYAMELEPGARLISWEEMNRKTGAGYLFSFSYATNPDFCALTPTRDNIAFYPGPFTNGDRITIEYCPTITTNPLIPATNWGYLNNTTDQPMIPEDCQDALWMGAVAFLMPKAREFEGGQLYSQMYKAEVQRIKDNYTRDSAGDALILRPVEDILATSGWDGFYNVGSMGNY